MSILARHVGAFLELADPLPRPRPARRRPVYLLTPVAPSWLADLRCRQGDYPGRSSRAVVPAPPRTPSPSVSREHGGGDCSAVHRLEKPVHQHADGGWDQGHDEWCERVDGQHSDRRTLRVARGLYWELLTPRVWTLVG